MRDPRAASSGFLLKLRSPLEKADGALKLGEQPIANLCSAEPRGLGRAKLGQSLPANRITQD